MENGVASAPLRAFPLRLELTMVASPTLHGVVLAAFGGIGGGFGRSSGGGFALGMLGGP